jgi:hypothetical protein
VWKRLHGLLLDVADRLLLAPGWPGWLAGLAVLAALLAWAWVAVRVLPPYLAHYRFVDEVTSVARAPTRDDAVVRSLLERARRRAPVPLDVDTCHVETRQTRRLIRCDYRVTVEVLPWLSKVLDLRLDVDEPYFVEPEPWHL